MISDAQKGGASMTVPSSDAVREDGDGPVSSGGNLDSADAAAAGATPGDRTLLADLLDAIPAGIYRLRFHPPPPGAVIDDLTLLAQNVVVEFLSDRLRSLLRLEPGEIESLPGGLAERVHPDDLEGFVRANAVAFRRSTPFSWEGRRLVSGRVRWFRFESLPRVLPDGDVVFTGVATDVTDRKEAEDALRESEERFRITFDQAPVGAAIVSLEKRFLRVNEMLCRITGYSAAELVGRRFGEITHPDDVKGSEEAARKLVANELERYDVDERFLRKDGRAVWVRLVVRTMKDASGRSIGFLPMMQDIGDRKRDEARIAAQLEELSRWHQLTLGREGRILELKREVNALLARAGDAPRYESVHPAAGEPRPGPDLP